MLKKITLAMSCLIALTFQNCSKVGFTNPSNDSAQSQNEASIPGDAFGQVQQGLSGGHFDLDTSSQIYPLSAGRTDHHVHEYDDKFNVTYADFFRLLDSKFGNISEQVSPSARFVLIIANANLSPGGVLSINGQSQSVVEYQKKVAAFIGGNTAALNVFTLDGSSGQKLSDLKIGFTPDALTNGGLIGTVTTCVVGNDPGAKGEYRNGALIIQAIDVSTLQLNASTGVAAAGLLWESTIFWHWDKGCY